MSKAVFEQIAEGLKEATKAQTWGRISEFRQVVPQGTTTEPPKLQQAWQCMETGEIRWQTISVVTVSNAEFFAA